MVFGNGEKDNKETAFQRRKAEILKQREERMKRERDFLCVGIYGHPKTCKTSLALDCKDDARLFVLDFDNGCERTWRAAYDCDPNIEIYVPYVYDEYKKSLLMETAEMAETFIRMVDELIEEGENVKFVFDGLDKWIHLCFDIMTAGKKWNEIRQAPIMWGKRNKEFNDLLDRALALNCDRFFITHLKDKYEGIINPMPIGTEPDWHRTTPGKLSQLIEMSKKKTKGGIEYYGEIINSPNMPELNGKTYTVMTISRDNKTVEWSGIPELREGKL
jgi:hypothetical protein